MKGKKKKKERNVYLGSGLSVDQLVNEKRVDWCAPAATSMSSPSGRTGGRTGPPKRQHNQRHRFIYLTNLLILLAVWISVPQIINLGLVIIFKWNHIFVNFRIDAIRVNSSCDPGLMNYSFFLIILFFFEMLVKRLPCVHSAANKWTLKHNQRVVRLSTDLSTWRLLKEIVLLSKMFRFLNFNYFIHLIVISDE